MKWFLFDHDEEELKNEKDLDTFVDDSDHDEDPGDYLDQKHREWKEMLYRALY